MEKINIWYVVDPHEDNRPSIQWFLNENDAEEAADNVEYGEPLYHMVETFVGSNIHKMAQ